VIHCLLVFTKKLVADPMRVTLILLSLALIPVFTYWLRVDYARNGLPSLLRKASTQLAAAGIEGVTVNLSYLDASLTGFLTDPDSRNRAEQIVERLPGVRVPAGNNLIRVAAALSYKLDGGSIQVRGWLPSTETKSALNQMISVFRPELQVRDAQIQISPHVELGKPVEMPEGPVPACFQTVLEDLRVPASLSIQRKGDVYVLKGMLRSEELRKAVITAAAISGWELDSSGLKWNAHCGEAPFNYGSGLPKFVEALFSSPSPAEFEIDVRNGPRVKGFITPGTEAVWLSLLRDVSGDAKVVMDVTRVPSALHFPDYQPKSPLPEGMTKPLVALLKRQAVFFAPGSDELDPGESVKLGGLLAAITTAGPGAKFVVAGYSDPLLEPESSNRLRLRRIEHVRDCLVRLGVAPEALGSSVFDAVRPSGPITEEARRDVRKVELLLE
jgi:outer membrane protein OmpA-like peptidoglycan-associated protein